MRIPVKSHEDKATVILETAQRRFAIYGVEKTTMREIAGDLNMSKGSLYYYFPDKENLYRAVIEKEQAEFIKILEEDLKKTKDPADGLKKYVINRLSYFKALVNLSRLRAETFTEYKPFIGEAMSRFREMEMLYVKELLDRGISSGIFKIDDSFETASLFLDLLRGLRSAVLSNKALLIIDDEEYRLMAEKAMNFTTIFINGLKKAEKG
jgi:AcrR family transcriptional regulator